MPNQKNWFIRQNKKLSISINTQQTKCTKKTNKQTIRRNQIERPNTNKCGQSEFSATYSSSSRTSYTHNNISNKWKRSIVQYIWTFIKCIFHINMYICTWIHMQQTKKQIESKSSKRITQQIRAHSCISEIKWRWERLAITFQLYRFYLHFHLCFHNFVCHALTFNLSIGEQKFWTFRFDWIVSRRHIIFIRLSLYFSNYYST